MLVTLLKSIVQVIMYQNNSGKVTRVRCCSPRQSLEPETFGRQAILKTTQGMETLKTLM